MAEQRDYIGLDWVEGEVKATLTETRQSLEQYAEFNGDASYLTQCQTRMQQIVSTMKMLEQHGARLLTEEVLELLFSMNDRPVAEVQEHLVVVMQSLLLLPDYLEQVSRSGRDQPQKLKPILRQMRKLRDQSSLNDVEFFTPDINTPADALLPEQLDILRSKGFVPLLRKIRQKYQLSLASILRDIHRDKQLVIIGKIFAKLQNLCWGAPLAPLWDAAAALTEGLKEGSVSLDSDVITMLRELDHQLKLLTVSDVDGLNEPPSEQLLRHLLYRVALADSNQPLITSLNFRYGLDEALLSAQEEPEDELLNVEATQAVVASIREELASVKDILDLYRVNPEMHQQQLQQQLPAIEQIAHTLSILGMERQHQLLIRQTGHLQDILDGTTSSDDALLDIAGQLLHIETALSHFTRGSELVDDSESAILSDVHQTVLQEARQTLDQVRENVVDFLGNSHHRDFLNKLPPLMETIHGSLAMIHLERAAQQIADCAQHIDQHWLLNPQSPSLDEMEALADFITNINEYLEQLGRRHPSEAEKYLNMSEPNLHFIQNFKAPAPEPEAAKVEEASPTESPSSDSTATFELVVEDDRDFPAEPIFKPAPAARTLLENSQSVDLSPSETLIDDDNAIPFEISGKKKPPAQTEATIEFQSDDTAIPAPALEATLEAPVAPRIEDIPEDTPEASEVEEDSDDDIRACFIEEATEAYEQLAHHFQIWRQNPDQQPASLKELRRGFHTLKGSGRTVHAEVIGELAWSVENMLNKLLDGSIQVCDQMLELLDEVIRCLPDLISDFASDNQAFTPEVVVSLEKADSLGKGSLFITDEEDVIGEETPDTESEPEVTYRDEIIPEVAEEYILQQAAELSEQAEAVQEIPDDSTDHHLLRIFTSESESHLTVVRAFIRQSHQLGGNLQITDQVQRALHTLKGSAFMAEITPLATLITAIESTVKEYRSHQIPADEQVISLLEQGVDLIESGLSQLSAPPYEISLSLEGFLKWQQAIHDKLLQLIQPTESESKAPANPQDATLFLASDLTLLFDAHSYLKEWTEAIPVAELDRFKFELTLLAENASEARLTTLTQLCDVLLDVCVYLDKQETVLPPVLLEPLSNGFETLVDMMNQVAAQQTPVSPEPIFQELRNALLNLHDHRDDENTAKIEPSEPSPELIEEIVLESSKEGEPAEPDLLRLFLEEAFERVEHTAITLDQWLHDTNNFAWLDELQRDLHTLKGGARMAELHELADLCHGLEDIYQSITSKRCKPEQAPLALIQKSHDLIDGILQALSQNKPQPSAAALIGQLHQWSSDLSTRQVVDKPVASTNQPIEILPDYLGSAANTAEIVATPSQEPTPPTVASVKTFPVYMPPAAPATKETLPQTSDTVRMPAEQLESLINLAGEASITRSRVEQQLTDSNKLLEEMNATTMRIKDQLRRLDIETQTQIISRHQNDHQDENAHFDPLEMDQYSELTQLSHSLVETATDLMDLREVLQQGAKESERLLLQQARTQTELQEQLMSARMDSFSRLVPRLRKTVRQVSEELGKYVDLDVINAEGEMDRTMLEHMLAPLEHMLRNAISHGIEETPEARMALGKPEKGKITLSIQREGADIVLEVADDGRGIDIHKVRDRAIEQNLITATTALSDQDAMQLILRSGFSTADSVTQISGRGVGMDVVNSKVRQLGGSIMIGSEKGLGARFSLRLPFTQSISRALMVEVGSHLYAMPLPSIDGISMIEPQQLIDCYKNGTPLNYGGVDHKLIYMGSLLDRNKPKPLGERCPVILVERGDDRLALHVDTLVGTREIITKSLGAQFAGLMGVNGATILGDGRVVIIIDPAALYRRFSRHGDIEQIPDITTRERATRVLVVDDSVTVRKVTSRLLSRQGYEVDSAKDGVEAMTKLLEERPDIVLLDIEMPRMDGFEVASAMRNDDHLKEIPIIMITSRTGEKHRNRAFNLGVNDYIGKPFQEGPLLEAISKLAVTA